MSSIGRRPRRRAALAATAMAACLAITATACNGDEESETDARPTEDAPADDGSQGGSDALQDILDNLPFDINVDEWIDGGWQDWDTDRWLREIGQFLNPIIEGLWDQDRMEEAEDPDVSIDEDDIEEGGDQPAADNPDDDRGVTDAEPEAIDAVQAGAPYSGSQPPVGKVFFDSPEGPMVCSGTVVSDPNAPGQSNLVATAGHCVHAGAEGGWYRNIVFVPYYNDGGLSAEESYQAPLEEIAPYGAWWAEYVATTDYWISNGSEIGGDGAHGDFAIMSVVPEDGSGQSLEERVGGAVDINFDTPAVSGLGETTLYGYPAAPPYDGETLYTCNATPSRLSFDASMPVMYWAGCTMTGGASGGAWLRQGDSGEPELISVNSLGTIEPRWMAGPRLEDEAREVFEYVSEEAAG
ncbi:hypothetical protein [Streptomyces sp. 7-21]|uniref:trypsin-like serine peptidase n=1 Tax=Streptomyces sp. 7-21 TaxID=2802283 RepID=UPI00191FC793|nr:hypothetical protein [Streptomyces sp. 7-21]